MSEIAVIGYTAIALAFLATTVTGIAAVIAGTSGRERYRAAAEYGAYLVCTLYGVAATAMIHAFIHQDFSLIYVYRYSDTAMPWFYQLAAFWGGQAGSLMFWAVILSLLMALVTISHRRRDAALMPWVIAVMCSVLLFFGALLLWVSNPFESFQIIDAPGDGQGLNPQLQTFTMIIHPPSLLIGYVSATVPFAFAMAALISGRVTDADWLKAARKWTLICWGFLTIGLILGMLWAYTELGWGGYWAWDPVENAAFIPWLVLTAFLHSAVIQEKRGMLKRWNMFLVLFAWLLTIFGTFLTRSGLIASVHSFAKSDIGDYFLYYMLLMFVVIAVAFGRRWRDLEAENQIETPLSREFAFLFNNWILLFGAGVVFVGTMFPKLKEMFTGDTATLGPRWFDQWMTPVGLAMLALTGVGVVISWRRATKKNFRRNFVRPLLFAGFVTGVAPLLYYKLRIEALNVEIDPLSGLYALFALFACAFVTGTIWVEFYRGTRVRMSKLGVGPMTALTGLILRNQRRYGGYIVHLGIAALMFGFVGNSFGIEEQVIMRPGETTTLGDYKVTLTKIWEEQDPEKEKFFAEVELRDGETDELISTLYPGRFFYHASQAATSEVDIRSTPFEDVYFAVVNYEVSERDQVVALMMVINPFVWWIWIGGIVMVFGTLLCMWPVDINDAPRKGKKKKPARSTVVGIVALLLWPVFLLAFEGSALAADDHDHDVEVGPAKVTYEPAVQRIFDRVRCECTSCEASGSTLSQCKPSCGEGARDRARIVELHADGLAEDAILETFKAERGDDAVTAASTDGVNNFSWLIPVLAATISVPLIIFAFARRRREDPLDAATDEAEDDERLERLDRLERALEAMD